MINQSTIYITRDDHAKLRLLLSTVYAPQGSPTLAQLREELDRAVIIDPGAVPSGIVTLDSRVEYEDVDTGEIEDYIITFPERANIDAQRISVLAPIGVALIGYRVGDIVHWTTPGGVRRLRIRRATPPSATSSLTPPSRLPAAVDR